MSEKERKKGSGGARPGAGRKPLSSEEKVVKEDITISVVLTRELIDRLDEIMKREKKSRSRVVREILEGWLNVHQQ